MKIALKKTAKQRWAWILTIVMAISVIIPASLLSAKAGTGNLTVSEAAGWLESAYAEWAPVNGADGYNAYVKKAGSSSYTQLDTELIRLYKDNNTQYYRVDALGLTAGEYQIKIAALSNGKESSTIVTDKLTVTAHDRTGFAFVNGTASGSYNEDGSLKDDAVVLYITENTKNSVKLDVVTSSKGTKTTGTGLQAILTLYKKGYDVRPLDIRLVGEITDLSSMENGDILIDGGEKGNTAGITFEGVGEDATANGWGLRIKGASNVEVRNIGFMNCNSGEGDDVGLQQDNDHVWVHNCDFFYGDAGSDKDQVKGDGALDTKTSTYITHSYNHFYDSGKSNLQGMKSESTENYITYHHNWYDHSDSRHPRIRTCSVHIYNNYYDGNAKYGVGVTMGASVFVEGNYFRNCKYPMLISMQGSDVISDWTTLTRDEANLGTFSGEAGGVIKSLNNYMEGQKSFVTYQQNSTEFDAYEVSASSEKVPSSVTSYKGSTAYNNFDTSSIMYDYTVQTSQAAKASVEAYAGRMNGGDFTWEFEDSVDDASYEVNTELKAALVSYTTKLVSVGGNSVAAETPTESTTQATTSKPTESTTQATTSKPTESTTQATTSKPTESTTQATTESTTEETKPTVTPSTDEYDKTSTSDSGAYTSLSTVSDSVYVKKLYVSPDGTSNGSGSQSKPYDLETAIAKATAGTAIIMLGGTYTYDHQVTIGDGNDGTADCYKVLKAAEGASVTLDFSSQPYGDTASNARGLQVEGDYWYVYGLTCYGAADNGIFLAGSNNVIERCILQGNRDTGLQVSRRNSSLSDMKDWPSDNYIINCTSFDNCDPATGENADGFAAKLTCGNGNVFDGCIAYCNCDDGWDLYAKEATGSIGVVTIRNCIAFGNGTLTNGNSEANGDMNGFKLGGSNGKVPTAHVVFNSLAFNNGKDGFTDNGNGGSLSLMNCTSYNNAKGNFNFYRTTAGGTFFNLLSATGNGTDKFIGRISNSITCNSGKYYQVPFSLSGTAVTSGQKLGDVVSNPFTSGAFTSTAAPSVTENIDSVMRNADGTVTTNGFLMSTGSYASMGAKYNVANQVKTVNAYVTGGSTPVPPTEPETTTEATTSKPTESTTEVTTSKPTESTTEATTAKPTESTTESTTEDTKPSSGETQVHNFTADGTSSSFYAISGNTSTSKGKVTYNGLTLTKCLKMESKTSVSFTATAGGTLTLVFNSQNSSNVKVDGEEYALSNGILTLDLEAGSHKITKASSANLYYIAYAQAATGEKLVLDVASMSNGTYTTTQYTNGFAILASTSKSVVVDSSVKGSFTKRIKLGGAGSSDARAIAFTTAGKSEVTVYAMSANTSSVRTIQVTDTAGNVVASKGLNGSTLGTLTLTVDEAGTYYVSSAASGMNVYSITVSNGIKMN